MNSMCRSLKILCVVQALLLAAGLWWNRDDIGRLVGVCPIDRDIEKKVAEFVGSDSGHYLIRIESKSSYPNPAESPYPHCLAVALATVHDGRDFTEECLVALPAFVDRKPTSYSELPQGAMLIAKLVPFRNTPEQVLAIQRSDDIGRFDLELFYADKVLALTTPVADDLLSQLPIASKLPEPAAGQEEKAEHGQGWELRKEAIESRRDRARQHIASLLDTSGGSWEAWSEEAAAVRRRHFAMGLEQGGIHFERGAHFYLPRFHLGYEETAAHGAAAPSLDSLAALHDDLSQGGIHLVAVPIPHRDEVAAIRACPQDRPRFDILSPERQLILASLLQRGVDVVDVLPWLLEMPAGTLPYFDCADHHLAPEGIVRVANGLADLLEGYGAPRQRANAIRRENQTFRIPGDGPKTPFPPNSIYSALTLTRASEGLPPAPGIYLAGDCHAGFPDPWKHANANLHDHLSWELGTQPGFFWSYGASGEIRQHLRRHWHDVKESRLLIFVFDSSFFTDKSQWQVPQGDDARGFHDRTPLFP